jgi:phage regulator Rha-like protein
MPDAQAEISSPLIENRILLVRGQKVMLDTELAELYGVPTGRLNEAVKRNRVRFPEDFMFQLTRQEARELEALRSQNATLKRGQHRKYTPFVFTEHGIAMLSSVLNSERAILVNIAIVRTFVRLRQILATHEELAQRLELLEWRQDEQAGKIQAVFETIQQLIDAPGEEPPKRHFGFLTSDADTGKARSAADE